MHHTITKNDFVQAFLTSSERKEQFSYDALGELFDYLDQLENECDQSTEFDMIAICCAWCEYADLDAVIAAYSGSFTFNDGATDDEKAVEIRENTTLIEFDGGVIIHNF